MGMVRENKDGENQMAKKRVNTSYPGVYYLIGTSSSGKPERMYYIRYRLDGKTISERAGWQFKDAMTPARAARIRAAKIEGRELSNTAKRAAEKAASEAEAGKWTIDRLWAEYSTQREGADGQGSDKSRYNKYIRAKFGNLEPNELVQLEIDRLRIKLLKTKSPQTVKHVLTLLQRICNFGINRGLCRGPGFKFQTPRVNNLRTEDLTPDQLTVLLKAIDEDEHPQAGPMMKLALFSGMRRGELFKLQWQDIDFEKGFIHLIDTKGGKPEIIPLNDGARGLLEEHPRTESLYVFPGRDGGQRQFIRNQVNRIRDKAGLPKDFRALHGLRHVYASMLASSGQVDLYTLQKLLTHKSPVMTQRYAHLRDETLKKASNVAGEIVDAAMNGEPKKVIEMDR